MSTHHEKKEEEDLDVILEFAIEIAKKAGKLILDGQSRRFSTSSTAATSSTGSDGKIEQKKNSVDLVTEVDQAVEAFLISEISRRFPSHNFVGEETFAGDAVVLSEDEGATWIVDPIDGTTNFIHGFPFVATSIGVTIRGKPVVGVIFNPFLDQLYYAAKGRGAFLSSPGRETLTRLPITGSPPPTLPSLSSAIIGVEWGSSRTSPELLHKSRLYERLAGDPSPSAKDIENARKKGREALPVKGGKMVHSLRSLGSAALNICMVATGGMDVYWEVGCWPWDVCAGMVILQESGGMAFGSKFGDLSGEVTPEILCGRKYLFVRAMSGGEGETADQAQKRIVNEFYEAVEVECDP